MRTQYLDYHDDGTLLEAYVAFPDGGTAELRPAVLVSHAWAGRGAFECEKAEELAELGYIGIALDNYGKGVRGRDNAENAALMQPFMQDRGKLRRRLAAGLDAARALPGVDTGRMAAIGFCFGGLCVLDMARSGADLRGVVSFHGLFHPAAGLPNAKIGAKILALHGNEDPLAPPAMAQALAEELTAAGADWQLHIYGGARHAFTNPQAASPENGLVYDARAAGRAWRCMQDFLAEALG